MNDKLAIAKGITKFVVTQSVGFVVGSAVKTNVPTTNKTQQVEIVIGAYVLGAMIGDKASDYVDQKFDKAVTAVKEFANKNKETVK